MLDNLKKGIMARLVRKLVNRAETAERAVEVAKAHVQNIEQVVNTRPFLVSIERDGRVNRFTFMRGMTPYVIDTYGTMADDIEQWRADLLA